MGIIYYFCFSLVSIAVLEGCDLASSQGPWVILLGCQRGEIIWAGGLGPCGPGQTVQSAFISDFGSRPKAGRQRGEMCPVLSLLSDKSLEDKP